MRTIFNMADVSEKTGLSKDTIRYYEKEQIIPKVERDEHGYRCFTAEDIEWINLIKILRTLKVPVKDLKGSIFTSMKERKTYLEEYEANIDEQITELKRIKTQLHLKINRLG